MRALPIFFAFLVLLIATSARAGEFRVNSQQYKRTLELMQAKGVISNLTNACEIDEDKTYLCTAKSNELIILYRAPKDGDALTNITIGATVNNIAKAAQFAAMASLSLDNGWVAMGATPRAATIFSKEIIMIKRIMENTYVTGGSDVSEDKFSEQFYMNNEKGDMTMVRVVAK